MKGNCVFGSDLHGIQTGHVPGPLHKAEHVAREETMECFHCAVIICRLHVVNSLPIGPRSRARAAMRNVVNLRGTVSAHRARCPAAAQSMCIDAPAESPRC